MIHILALGPKGELGFKGDLPWGRDFPEDLSHFFSTTSGIKGSVLVMGYNTFISLGSKFFRGLKNRKCIVVTSRTEPKEIDKDKVIFCSFQDMIRMYLGPQHVPWFVIGGKSLYESTLQWTTKIILTRIPSLNLKADVFMDISKYPSSTDFQLVHTQTLDDGLFVEEYIFTGSRVSIN